MKIIIRIGKLAMESQLHDTPTARLIYDALPVTAQLNTWGDEIYFSIPVKADLEDTAATEVSMGDLGYWPPGSAFCIFFGETPMSPPGKIVPASAVNVVGRVIGDATVFKGVMHEQQVTLDKA
jgi:uncharacterized protein